MKLQCPQPKLLVYLIGGIFLFIKVNPFYSSVLAVPKKPYHWLIAQAVFCYLLIVTSLMLLGTGKTQLVTGMLRELLPTKFVNVSINLNYYSSGSVLLGSLEAPLQKRTGSTFGPPGSTRLVYFVGACICSLIIPYTIPRR